MRWKSALGAVFFIAAIPLAVSELLGPGWSMAVLLMGIGAGWLLVPGFWRSSLYGAIGGVVAGLLILGPGLRIAMRVVAIVDPVRIGPAFWFQQMDQPRPQRNRIHIDVTVPHDAAEARIADALAAGGTLVSDRRARAFWVLADPEGNEACICTWQDRD